jgi:hypothetical protein
MCDVVIPATQILTFNERILVDELRRAFDQPESTTTEVDLASAVAISLVAGLPGRTTRRVVTTVRLSHGGVEGSVGQDAGAGAQGRRTVSGLGREVFIAV